MLELVIGVLVDIAEVFLDLWVNKVAEKFIGKKC